MKTIATRLASCAIAMLAAIGAARAEDAVCQAPARIDAEGAAPAPRARVENYRPVFEQCRNGAGALRLAIRRFSVDGSSLMLTVDPATLATSLEHAQCWTCAETNEAAQKDTRFIRAVEAPSQHAINSAKEPGVTMNAGLSHGQGDGSFITGDLCPSLRPLDRAFLEKLEALGPRTPVALSISGLWLMHHWADFEWLRRQARAGALEIAWVDHSYHHPYVPGRPPGDNYLLTPGVDMQAEILETERLLIANGETPSAFFRFPDLVSDEALTEIVRRDHLVTLGADGWLVFAPPLRPGAILLVHANGNEPEGLRLFSKLLDKGRLPRPFRPIGEAP
jgi:hypothetical protein